MVSIGLAYRFNYFQAYFPIKLPMPFGRLSKAIKAKWLQLLANGLTLIELKPGSQRRQDPKVFHTFSSNIFESTSNILVTSDWINVGDSHQSFHKWYVKCVIYSSRISLTHSTTKKKNGKQKTSSCLFNDYLLLLTFLWLIIFTVDNHDKVFTYKRKEKYIWNSFLFLYRKNHLQPSSSNLFHIHKIETIFFSFSFCKMAKAFT